ncbi:hypothetical protein [uncultured Tenacibaculum sp.]|uniref:hypothetical protein n=1 Tax=uncultured Tenacibaculum sp. TaxID=174713 RepID=UPI002627566F|nr:hypothetical protein [uncultured Tenacibaculum sp.]
MSSALKHKNDFQTPTDVAKYMVNMLPSDIVDVLEPTAGLGRIKTELELKGYNVTAPEDYFLLEKKKFDAVVMNPPFSGKSLIVDNAPLKFHGKGMQAGYMILWECMQMADTVIALMPWFTISDSDPRMRSIKRYGLKSITVLPRKTFDYTKIQTCVLELKKGWTADTIFYAYEFMHEGKEYQPLSLNL